MLPQCGSRLQADGLSDAVDRVVGGFETVLGREQTLVRDPPMGRGSEFGVKPPRERPRRRPLSSATRP